MYEFFFVILIKVVVNFWYWVGLGLGRIRDVKYGHAEYVLYNY